MAVGIPNFPTSLDAASDLVEATNNASTTINMVGGLSNSATTITVVSTAAFPSTGIIRIDDELISYSAKTSTTFTVQTRGFESTTAASHIDGATVSLDITAASNNAKNTAIIALETKVGTGSSTPTANTVLRGTGTGTTAFGQVGLTTDVTGTLPAANGGTGITSLGANVATFLGTPSSANLASAVTDETGSGALVFGTSPSLTTPGIGSGGFTIAGSSSGQTTIITSAVGSGTVTIPAVASTATLATALPSVALSPTSSNPTVTLNQRHFIDLSGLTANRDFVLPAGAVGDVIVVSITAGNSSYAMILKGTTSITINNGPANTEWSRLFITGESVTFVANSTTNWQVLEDGRIPVLARMHYNGAGFTIPNATTTKAPLNTIKFDNASVCDTTNNEIKFRRTNKYLLTGGMKYDTLPANIARVIAWGGLSGLAQAAEEIGGLVGTLPTFSLATTTEFFAGDTRQLWLYQTVASGPTYTLSSGGGPELIHLDCCEVF